MGFHERAAEGRECPPNTWKEQDKARLRDECLRGDLLQEGAYSNATSQDEEQTKRESSCNEGEDPESSLSER